MSSYSFLKASDIFIEIGHTSLKVWHEQRGADIALERGAQGRLTPLCAENVRLKLGEFLRAAGRMGRFRAVCGLSARGISLRKLTLPPASKENFDRVLSLQIEKDLPLSPDELAWGYYEVPTDHLSLPGTKEAPELIVAATKRETLQEYAEIFDALDVEVVFTLGILAANSLCPRFAGATAILDLGRSRSELMVLDNGLPLSVRTLAWGGDYLTDVMAKALGVGRDDAERFKLALAAETGPPDKVHAAIGETIASLAGLVRTNFTGAKLYVVGGTARLPNLAVQLQAALPPGVECRVVDVPPGPGKSAATIGLERHWEKTKAYPPLRIETREAAKTSQQIAEPARRKWVAVALLLLLASVSLRYAEAYWKKPRLEKRLADFTTAQAGLPEVDRELNFLQYLETNRPPYLEALAAVASAAPRGTRIDSVTLSRRGDFAARGTLATSQQATEFRSKLIGSGLFSNVVMEEQTPIPNQQQKVTVRVSARWRTAVATKSPSAKTATSTNQTAAGVTATASSNSGPALIAPPAAPK